MQPAVIFVSLLAVFCVCKAKNLGKPREKRWFGGSYTTTVIKPKMVTSLVPSSCVKVEASIPPCRNVRYLNNFPDVVSGRLIGDDTDINGEDLQEVKNAEENLETTPLSWGEYIGIYAPTVTTTALYLETTTMMDPRTIVTFSVKGCRPSRLPLDLDTCPEPQEPILPSKVTTMVMTSTVFKPDILDAKAVEASELEEVGDLDGEPTKELNSETPLPDY